MKSQPSLTSDFLQNPGSHSQGAYHAQSDIEAAAAWEAAYSQFETSEQEIRKFVQRLTKLGAGRWPHDLEIVELFCGRGNGLHALKRLGFTRLEGIDLSATLLAQYAGPAKCYVGDCRQLPFADASKEIAIVQGGLHHLPTLLDDLEQTLSEIHRVLRDHGLLVVVEPWLTPFLSFVHAVSRSGTARRLSRKVNAFATMFHHERQTYEQWLGKPQAILRLFDRYFYKEQLSIRWGKLSFVGRKRAPH